MNSSMDAGVFQQTCDAIKAQIGHVLLGQEDVVDQVLVAVLARGHVLIEGVPGLGKTLLVRVLSQVLGCQSRRIQFTPDLMPSDVTGGNVYNQQTARFEFNQGPVFTQLLLADEINRATAKTQSALLEAMQERSVTVDGATRALPRPFFVLATQNPVESQGTYPLPEAQLDRFMLKVNVDHPTKKVELRILENYARGFDPSDLEGAGLQQVVDAEGVRVLQDAARMVRIEADVLQYIVEIVTGTRSHRALELGASPRASIALLQAGRVRAAMEGRDFVIPDDVKSLAAAILRHRVILHPDAEFEGLTADDIVREVVEATPVPKAAG
ncbi:MAG: MoxR family ATPase [Myxococcales bacterium]|nr:MoxR family ATPase [Myxococcales bacterium]